ncbi:MAG: hypothetical protein KDE56_12955 [Anaerolineales bacterium]|nr:hypothetical protein [Anaerolineales bacterium]
MPAYEGQMSYSIRLISDADKLQTGGGEWLVAGKVSFLTSHHDDQSSCFLCKKLRVRSLMTWDLEVQLLSEVELLELQWDLEVQLLSEVELLELQSVFD